MSSRLLTTCCAVLLLVALGDSARAAAGSEKISPKKLTRKARAEMGRGAEVFYGGTMIAAGTTREGPVIVINGSLDIQEGAVLDGDAWIINGSLVITGAGAVTGEVSLVNSEIYASHRAEIRGSISYYRCECRLDAEAYEKKGEIKFVKHEDPMALKTKPVVEAGWPTRVRYDVVGLGFERRNERRRDPYVQWKAVVNIPLYKSTQHGFLGFDASMSVPLAGHALGLEMAAYKSLDSEDFWQVSRIENSVFLMMSANEYANYYEKRGGAVGLRWQPHPFVTVGVKGLFQRDVSMETQDEVFTIVGSKGNLAPNPPIEDGDRLAGRLTVAYDSREDRDFPRNAWMCGLAVESGRLSPNADRPADAAGPAGAADLDYTAFTIQANRYSHLPFELQWDIGARLSSSFGAIPFQLYQTLNGYGGVRGTDRVPFDVARGDRVVRVSTELRHELPELPVVRWVYSRWDLMGFADAGLLAEAACPSAPFGFLDTSFDGWKKTVGLGVSGESFVPYLGFYVAQEINGSRTRPRFIFRIERTF